MNNYISLQIPEESALRFHVTHQGYVPIRRKHSNVQHTITGKVDHQEGPINLEWQFELMVPAVAPENYGALSDLKEIYDASGAIVFTDHANDQHSVYMTGELTERPLGPMISGECARFLVPIHLIKAVPE